MTTKSESPEKQVLTDLWSLILIRGISMVILGIVLLAFPMGTLTFLIIVLGAWWLIDGIVTIVKSIKGRKQQQAWGWGIFTGILGAIAGIVVLSQPALSAILTTSFLVWFLGLAALIYGINGIVTGIKLRKKISGEWSMILGGILSILFGILLLTSPFVSALTIVTVIGIFAIIGGITVVVIAFQVRNKSKKNN
jgi:uncharacterized membrane protein HdeD (DUF308 family)